MDAIRLTQPIAKATPTLPAPAPAGAPAVAVPNSAQAAPLIGGKAADQVNVSNDLADKKRLEAVQRLAQDIANVFVVSDKTFSIFKDTTGQYITRFTSLRDGKVTYIPEPQLFKLGGGSDVQPLLKINV